MPMPNHIAISLDDISDWCRKNNASYDEGCGKYFEQLDKLFNAQIKLNITILTIYLLPDIAEKDSENYLIFSDFLKSFFDKLAGNAAITANKIKISMLGKWYNLPGKAVESLKKIIEETKDFDAFFTNFCINYDGREEIADACRLVAKQVELGKIAPEMIAKENIRENLYSSYFMPPDLILIYGERKLTGLLLWDSANSGIAFADKSFMEFEEGDLRRLIGDFE